MVFATKDIPGKLFEILQRKEEGILYQYKNYHQKYSILCIKYKERVTIVMYERYCYQVKVTQ